LVYGSRFKVHGYVEVALGLESRTLNPIF